MIINRLRVQARKNRNQLCMFYSCTAAEETHGDDIYADLVIRMFFPFLSEGNILRCQRHTLYEFTVMICVSSANDSVLHARRKYFLYAKRTPSLVACDL